MKKKSVEKLKRKSRSVNKPRKLVRATQKKINLVLKNLILFIILFVLSFVLYFVSEKEMYTTLFGLLSVVLGFVAVAFLIVLLVFFFLRAMKK